MFRVENITIERNGLVIQKNITFPRLRVGQLLLITGKNGVGKSSMLSACMGISGIEVLNGTIELNEVDLLALSPAERYKTGLFLTYQNPPEIEGVTIAQLAKHLVPDLSMTEVLERLRVGLKILELEEQFMSKFVHAGLSGGQKKLVELLQAFIARPKVVLIDEVDSGLDLTKQKMAITMIQEMQKMGTVVVIVSHSPAFSHHLNPDYTLELL